MSQTLPVNTILHGRNYQYCIEKVLGQGSFGITYLAKVKLAGALGELQSNVRVAVKEFFMKDVNGRSGTHVLTGGGSDLYHKYRRDFIREAENLSAHHRTGNCGIFPALHPSTCHKSSADAGISDLPAVQII